MSAGRSAGGRQRLARAGSDPSLSRSGADGHHARRFEVLPVPHPQAGERGPRRLGLPHGQVFAKRRQHDLSLARGNFVADDGAKSIGARFIVLKDFEPAGPNGFNELGDASSERRPGRFEHELAAKFVFFDIVANEDPRDDGILVAIVPDGQRGDKWRGCIGLRDELVEVIKPGPQQDGIRLLGGKGVQERDIIKARVEWYFVAKVSCGKNGAVVEFSALEQLSKGFVEPVGHTCHPNLRRTIIRPFALQAKMDCGPLR